MTNSSPVTDGAPDVLDGRVHPRAKEIPASTQYRTTLSNEDSEDFVVVQPSFDDHGEIVLSGSSSSQEKSRERQSRSPDGDNKEDDPELRNPSSPDRQERGPCHTRNLSALFGKTSISDDTPGPEHIDAELVSRKHRRMFSGDVTNPNLAHRRLNSGGNAAPVPRRHHRESSEGLDILSAAANASKEELAAVAGTGTTPVESWEVNQQPRPSIGQVSASSSSSCSPRPPLSYGQVSTRSVQQQHQMEPPPQRQRGHHPLPQQHPGYVVHYPTEITGSNNHLYPVHHHGGAYYDHHYSSKGPMHHYSPEYLQQPPEYYKVSEFRNSRAPQPQEHEPNHFGPDHPAPEWESRRTNISCSDSVVASSSHQGVQTFVTAIAVGKGNRIVPTSSKHKNAATNTEPGSAPLPSEVGHHRNLSSFSSLGTILGSSIYPEPSAQTESEENKKKEHHRATSSSVSFLNGFEVGLDDANFLRNLQASNASSSSYRGSPPPAQRRVPGAPLPRSPSKSPPPQEDSEQEEGSEAVAGGILKLAAGGTSKRVRRKCTAPGCTNRVVQGGLCISHGAKRKICKHPGCNKNVKKAGLCSTHGPARKRCEHAGCSKVAVQGGRCIAHGAKKKLCSVEACTKQAILSGMCKKHHDQAQHYHRSVSVADDLVGADPFCRPVATTGIRKPTHTRGLSIFQEMSADAVSTLLNDPNSATVPKGNALKAPVAPPSSTVQSGRMW